MKKYFVILLLLNSFNLFGQDIIGYWTGQEIVSHANFTYEIGIHIIQGKDGLEARSIKKYEGVANSITINNRNVKIVFDKNVSFEGILENDNININGQMHYRLLDGDGGKLNLKKVNSPEKILDEYYSQMNSRQVQTAYNVLLGLNSSTFAKSNWTSLYSNVIPQVEKQKYDDYISRMDNQLKNNPNDQWSHKRWIEMWNEFLVFFPSSVHKSDIDLIIKRLQNTIEKLNQDENQKEMIFEKNRIAKLKSSEIGDRICYSQDWTHTTSSEGFFGFGAYENKVKYKMMVICYIERKEGNKYQVRVANIQSSDGNNYTTPDYKGVKMSEGSIHWISPLTDKNWLICE